MTHLLRLFFSILLCALLFLPAAAQEATGTHTVYFHNPGKTPVEVNCYVWQDDKNNVATFPGEAMERTKYYVETPDGVKSQVFSYTFSWDKTPNFVIFSPVFSPAATTDPKKQSADYTFSEGALYTVTEEKFSEGTLDFNLREIEKPLTVYFADKAATPWGAENTLVHIWGEGVDYTAFLKNEGMKDTGKLTLLDGRYYPVYEYKIYTLDEITSCLFRKNGSSNITPDSKFVDGGLYYYNPNSTEPVVAVENPKLVDAIPQHTVYFADTGNWGAKNTLVHIWGKAGEYTAWSENEPMTDTGKYTLAGDVWAKVYTYTYTYPGEATHIKFHCSDYTGTADCELVPGTMYCGRGNKVPPMTVENPVLYDEIPHDTKRPVTFYANLGANQGLTNEWKEPCAHVWRRDVSVSYEDAVPAYGSEAYLAERMEKVRDGLYSITVDDVTDCTDIIFYYYSSSGSGDETVYTPHVLPASRSPHFNPMSWTKFMYDIGTDCFHQSYLTPEAYYKVWNSLPEVLYVTGNKSVTGNDTDDPRYCLEIKADEGVYVNKFTISDDEVAMFKLSCFNVMGAFGELGFPDTAYESQRGWATFNMGIIGCQEPDNDPSWRDKFIYKNPDNPNESRQVKLPVNYSMNFNNSTQYPWRIAKGNEGITGGGDYWLVVDLHDDDHSLTLLTFDPNPQIEIMPGEITAVELPVEKAAALHDGSLLKGSAQNGPVYFNKVNIVSGKAEIQSAPGNNILDDNLYSVVYTVYLEGIPVAEYDHVPDEVEIPYMTAGKDASVAVRARYTHGVTDVSFCSRMAKGSVSPDSPELPVPQSSDVTGVLVMYGSSDEAATPTKAVGGAVSIPYNLYNDNNLAFFPDYEVLDVTSSGNYNRGEETLIHSQHAVVKLGQFSDYLGSQSESPWIPTGSETLPEELDDSNNWAAYIADECNLPLFITELGRTDGTLPEMTATATVKLHAVYPFLVKDLSHLDEAAGAPVRKIARAADATITLPDNLEGFTIVPMTTTTTVKAGYSGEILTSIETVDRDTDTEDTAIYYTIDGKLLSGRPASPGLYLRRTARGTEKCLIR